MILGTRLLAYLDARRWPAFRFFGAHSYVVQLQREGRKSKGEERLVHLPSGSDVQQHIDAVNAG